MHSADPIANRWSHSARLAGHHLTGLELTNGGTLGKKLKVGARYWMQREGKEATRLVKQLYIEATRARAQ